MYDTFNRADSGVTLGNADSGETWQTSEAWGISGNKAYCPGASNGRAWVMCAEPPAIVEIDMTYASSTSECLRIRQFDADNALELIIVNTAAYFYKVVAGAYTPLVTVSFDTYNTGQTYHFLLGAYANNLYFYQDGVGRYAYVLSAPDTAFFSAATGVGFRSNNSAVRYDNLVTGGDVATAGAFTNSRRRSLHTRSLAAQRISRG